jgi:hypothetical protein
MEPLTAFTHWGHPAPYLAKPPDFLVRTRVVAVRPKTPYVACRTGAIAHLHNGVAAMFDNNAARFGARFLCGGCSTDVVVLRDADMYGGVCPFCEDAAEGPCVYRCFNAARDLIYIGSAEKFLRRLQGHESRTPWWPEVAETAADRFPTIFEARAAERLAILAEQPLYNKQYKTQRKRAA